MNNDNRQRPEQSVRGLASAVAIVEEVAKHNRIGLTLTQLSTLTGLPKPTVHRLLAALVEMRLLSQPRSGHYQLGALCAILGAAFLDGLELRDVARPELERLASTSGETCHLGVLEGNHVVYIDKIESANAVRMYSRVGMSVAPHSSALGKAMLAHLRRGDLKRALPQTLEAKTPHTITDVARLNRELEEIRLVGYAVDREENELGIECVGAAIHDHSGHAVGAMSISVPKYRLGADQAHDLGRLVRDLADQVSAKLGYRGGRSAGLDGAPEPSVDAGSAVDQ